MGNENQTTALQKLDASHIFNLSKKVLTSDEESMLAKGLSFVPSKRTDFVKMKSEFIEFCRKLRLTLFFREAPSNQPMEVTGLRNKSIFCPPASKVPKNLLTFEKSVLSAISAMEKERKYVKYNTTKAQMTALNNLKTDSTVIIKQADKGGAIVVWDINDYTTEVMRQLADSSCYRKINKDPTTDLQNELFAIIQKGFDLGFVGPKEFEYLKILHPKVPMFYVLPKIHKDPDHPPGRPIVAGCGSVLEPAAKYVDCFLKEFMISVKSYLQDTTDFINKLERIDFCENRDRLVTMDVTALYTQIPQDEAIAVLTHYLDSRPRPTQVPTNFIVDLAAFALKKNYFCFNGEYYYQVKGVAMGCPFAPELAVLFMAMYEEAYIYQNNPFIQYIGAWLRFIDDVFMTWTGDSDTLDQFHQWLNDRTADIKFSISSSTRKIAFLDVEVFPCEGKLATTLYSKPTDRNKSLMFSSNHPRNLRENLPYGQFLRVRRNCTFKEDFQYHSANLTSKLCNRGYPKKLVKSCMKRAQWTPRETTLERKIKPALKRQVCVTTFCPNANHLKKVIKQNWHLVKDLDESLVDMPLFAFKKENNIANHIVRAAMPAPKPATLRQMMGMPPILGHHKCGTCLCCESCIEGSLFKHNGIFWKHESFSNCKSKFVVYGITCPCHLLYIGKTNQEIRQRISQHKSRIKKKVENAPLVLHWTRMQHVVSDLKWTVISKVEKNPRGGDQNLALSKREAFLIVKFDTSVSGLNELSEIFKL
ncbi:uncharacterized protein LOC144770079 [Lissotriton helveticus]